MNVKNITWRDLGLSPIYMLLDLRCKRHLDRTKLRQKKYIKKTKKIEEEMGHMISRDKACLKATRKPLKYLMESQRERREAAEETGLI